VLSEGLLKEVDRLAGKRKRSRFVEEALKEKLSRERLKHALNVSAGVLDPIDYPDWNTPEKASAWVRSSRQIRR
jgi:metal-responsive CopG/Arc/MetJ family transcriptional regulator